MPVSLTEFAKGGFLDDCDVEITDAETTMFDYAGKGDPTPGMMVTLDSGELEEPSRQFYSVGRAKDWAPNKDGTSFDAVGNREKIHESSSFAKFLAALIDAGLPKEEIGDSVKNLIGVRGHVRQVPQPKIREDDRERTLLLFTEIHDEPEAKGKVKEKAAAKSKVEKGKAKAKDDAPDEDVETAAREYLIEEIALAGGSIKKATATGNGFKKLDPSVRNAALKLIADEEWLAAQEEFEYEDGVLSLSG